MRTATLALLLGLFGATSCGNDEPTAPFVASSRPDGGAAGGGASGREDVPTTAVCGDRDPPPPDGSEDPPFVAPCEPETLLEDLSVEDTDSICAAFDAYFEETVDLDAWVDFICVQTLGAPSANDVSSCEAGISECRSTYGPPMRTTTCIDARDLPSDCGATVAEFEACATDLVRTTNAYAREYTCNDFLDGLPTVLPSPSFEPGTPCGTIDDACPGLM